MTSQEWGIITPREPERKQQNSKRTRGCENWEKLKITAINCHQIFFPPRGRNYNVKKEFSRLKYELTRERPRDPCSSSHPRDPSFSSCRKLRSLSVGFLRARLPAASQVWSQWPRLDKGTRPLFEAAADHLSNKRSAAKCPPKLGCGREK